MSWQPATSHQVDDHVYTRPAISVAWRSTSRLSAEAIGQTTKGHTIDGHELTVTVLKVGESASGCHLLYVTASEIKRSAGLLLEAKGASVFTVSNADGFAESGGVAQLMVENDRMRFTINIGSAQRAGLNISSKLLSLAKI